MRSVPRAVLMLAAVAAVASCSAGSTSAPAATSTTPSSSSSKPTTTHPTTAPETKAAYIVSANALCRTMNDRVSALADPGNDPAKQADANDRAAAITNETLRELRALPVPPGEQAAVAAIYAKVDVVVAAASHLSAALRAKDPTAAQSANATLEADAKAANDASNAYGLTTCGS